MKLRTWLTIKNQLRFFGIVLFSLLSYLPQNLSFFSILSGFIFTFILPGYLVVQEKKIKGGELQKFCHIIIASIMYWLIIGRIFVSFHFPITNNLITFPLLFLFIFYVMRLIFREKRNFSQGAQSDKKIRFKDIFPRKFLGNWLKKNRNFALFLVFLFVVSLYAGLRVPLVPVDDVWYHLTIIGDFLDDGTLINYGIYNGKTTIHFLWAQFLQHSQIPLLGFGKWVVLIQLPLGSLVFYQFIQKLIKQKNIAIISAILYSISSMGGFLLFSQVWPTAIAVILGTRLLQLFFGHLNSYLPSAIQDVKNSPSIQQKFIYYLSCFLISFLIIDIHISTFIVFGIPMFATLFIIMTRDKRALKEFLFIFFLNVIFLIYNISLTSYLVEFSFITSLFKGINLLLIPIIIAIFIWVFVYIEKFAAKATYSTKDIRKFKFKPQNSTVKLEKTYFWKVLIPILAFGAPLIYFLLNPLTKQYVQGNVIIIFIDLIFVSILFSIYFLVVNIFREESIQGKALWMFSLVFIGIILIFTIIGAVYTYILRVLLLWVPLIFTGLGFYLRYKQLGGVNEKNLTKILLPAICLFLIISISYHISYNEHLTQSENSFLMRTVQFSPTTPTVEGSGDNSSENLNSTVIGAFHFYYPYLFYSRSGQETIGQYNLENANLLRIEDHYNNTVGTSTNSGTNQLTTLKESISHNNLFLFMEESYISRGVLLVDSEGYGKMTQEEYDGYTELGYLNRVGVSNQQQTLYWVR